MMHAPRRNRRALHVINSEPFEGMAMYEPRFETATNAEPPQTEHVCNKKDWEAPLLEAVPIRETKNNTGGGLDTSLAGS
jgi:hypothetical protein